VLINELFLQL